MKKGKSEGLKNNKKAISTVAGLIDGFGSFMTAFGMLIFPLFEGRLFYLFTGSSFLSGLFICRMAIKDIKMVYKNSKSSKKKSNKVKEKNEEGKEGKDCKDCKDDKVKLDVKEETVK